MSVKIKASLIISFTAVIIAGLWWYLQDKTVALFEPAGIIALQEHRLFMFAVVLSLVGLVPIFLMIIFISIRYRDGNNATYTPNWKYNHWLSAAWLVVLITIIGALGIVSWQTTHALDPYRPLSTDIKPLKVQVVALQWKWLFLYPEQGIATVNYLNIPTDTPINLQLTADAPMNSFWIPQLAGQAYAMEGMVTKLHLMADREGVYNGQSAEISGEGFAAMHFDTTAMDQEDFDKWVMEAKTSSKLLDMATYDDLVEPDEEDELLTYSAYQTGLYDTIVMKFMPHSHDMPSAESALHTTEAPLR